jgi:hypothetical protein
MNLANVNLNMTPSTTAGNFSNFLFFLDQAGCPSNCPFQNQSQWQNVSMNSHGIIYLSNQQLNVSSNASNNSPPTQITLNPGSLILGMIEPSGRLVFTVTGYPLNQSGAPGQLQKTLVGSNTAKLVQ